MSRHAIPVAAVLVLVGTAVACSDPTSPTKRTTPTAPAVAAALNGAACGGVFGPTTFTRAAGTPAIERRQFTAPPGDWYKLVLLGADAATVRVALNDRSLITAGDNDARIQVPVALAAENLVELRLAGQPGSSVVLSIIDTRTVASLRIVPEVVQGTAYVLAGATRDFGAEVLDAQGRAITTACVTWRTADPAVATVNADGVVHGVAAGITQLVVNAGGVERSVTLAVLSPAGATTVRDDPTSCMYASSDQMLGCFASVLRATPVAGDETLIEVSIRNWQGWFPLSRLPGGVITDVVVTDAAGASPTATGGFSIAIDSGVTVAGTPTATLVLLDRIWDPEDTPYKGWKIAVRSGIAGCVEQSSSVSGPGYWHTCQTTGMVSFSFLAGGDTWSANSLFLYVTMYGVYVWDPLKLSCANLRGIPYRSCRPPILRP